MAPKRRAASPAATTSKRRRTARFGAAQETDKLLQQPQEAFLSSSSVSKRPVGKTRILTLSTIAARVFADNLPSLYGETEETRDYTKTQLQHMSDFVAARLFSALKERRPTMINHGLISAYFLQGTSISLSSELTQVNKFTIQSIAKAGTMLRKLELRGFEDIADASFASIFPSLPNLEEIILHGCKKVGENTTKSVSNSCPSLTVVNLSFTSQTQASLTRLLTSLPKLEVLKLSGLSNISNSFLMAMLDVRTTEGDLVGLALRRIKIRMIERLDVSLLALFENLPNLVSLDASFTRTTIVPPELSEGCGQKLEKLNLTSTPLNTKHLAQFLSHFPVLRILNLGGLGGGGGRMPTLRDEVLAQMTEVLKNFPCLESISLVGNSKLGLGKGQDTLHEFVRLVGRRCHTLNFASITQLTSYDLEGLLPYHANSDQEDTSRINASDAKDSISPLQDLDLSQTGIDDDAVEYIASCKYLRRLSIAKTRLSREAVLQIIDSCTSLEEIDLMSCREIKVTDRRRFFEVWAEERREDQE